MWKLAFQKQKTVMGITFQVRKRMTLRHVKSLFLEMVSSLLTQGCTASLWLWLSAVLADAFDLVFLAGGRQYLQCAIYYMASILIGQFAGAPQVPILKQNERSSLQMVIS